MRKQVVTFLFSFFIYHSLWAQLTKGNWMVGGNVGFSTGSYTLLNSISHSSDLKLSPSIGYFLKDRVPVGLRAMMTYHHATGVAPRSTRREESFDLSFGPYIRYYLIKNVENPVNFLIEGNYGFGYSTDLTRDGKNYLNQFSFMAGPTFYFNNSIGLEFTIGYYNSTQYKETTTGFKAMIGFQIHLEKEKNKLK